MQGSIYGTVEIQFSWSGLVKDQKIYWVEVMRTYRPAAFRFLLSKTPINSSLIKSYEPSTAKGPLKLVGGKWYWNENLTSEFMIADDLLLSSASGLDFVLHNKEICQPKRNACLDMKGQPSREYTGGKILAYILGHGSYVLDRHLKSSEPPAKSNLLLEGAYQGLRQALWDAEFGGALDSDASCDKAMLGALALYGTDKVDAAKGLLSLIMKKELFEKALQRLIRSHFNTPAWKPDPNVF
jgi:hypothetical protein